MPWRSKHPQPISHTRHVLVVRRTGKPEDSWVINNRLTTIIKNPSQDATKLKIVFVAKVVVSTIQFTKWWLQLRLLVVLSYQLVWQHVNEKKWTKKKLQKFTMYCYWYGIKTLNCRKLSVESVVIENVLRSTLSGVFIDKYVTRS